MTRVLDETFGSACETAITRTVEAPKCGNGQGFRRIVEHRIGWCSQGKMPLNYNLPNRFSFLGNFERVGHVISDSSTPRSSRAFGGQFANKQWARCFASAFLVSKSASVSSMRKRSFQPLLMRA